MTPRELDEYRALRATIRERGTARHWIVLAGTASWAALALGVVALGALPVLTLLPLLVLAGTFEVVFTLHTAVERVGRYVQVFHEDPSDAARWEHVAMTYGRTYGGGGIDALFSPVFWAAALLNAVVVTLSGPPAIDWAVVGLAHLLFIWRVHVARRASAGQRAVDLQRFEQVKRERPGT